jgi:hypothetical protein
MGSIISAVAVLLTHMLTSADDSRNPATIAGGRVPSRPMSAMATRRCSRQRCIASAIRKPPRKRKMIGFAKGAAVSRMSPSPSAGKRTSGSSAVAGIGIGSVIQKTAMRRAAPAVRQPASLSPSGAGTSRVSTSAPGPMIQPAHCRVP